MDLRLQYVLTSLPQRKPLPNRNQCSTDRNGRSPAQLSGQKKENILSKTCTTWQNQFLIYLHNFDHGCFLIFVNLKHTGFFSSESFLPTNTCWNILPVTCLTQCLLASMWCCWSSVCFVCIAARGPGPLRFNTLYHNGWPKKTHLCLYLSGIIGANCLLAYNARGSKLCDDQETNLNCVVWLFDKPS